jgi:hypothetical protein
MAKFSDRDNGYKRVMQALTASGGALRVTVGIHAEEGGAGKSDGATIVEVAEINEFGLGVPPRPVISVYADQKGPEAIRAMADRAAAGVGAGRPIAQSLDQMAQVFAGEIQDRYAAGVPPPNAPATIARKGSSKPRIDTGQERAAIRGRVRQGGP